MDSTYYLVLFNFKSSDRVVVDLANHYSQDTRYKFEVEYISSSKELVQFISSVPRAVLLFNANNKKVLTDLLVALKQLRKVVKTGHVKASGFSAFQKKKNVETAFKKLGVQETLDADIKLKSLKFKVDMMFKTLNKSDPSGAGADDTKKAKRKKKKKTSDSSAKSNEVIFKRPLKLKSDMWLIEKDDCKKVLSRWLISVVGPSPYAGQWRELESKGSTYFRFDMGPSKDDFIYEEGSWFFTGGGKPDFDWKTNKWVFAGDKIRLLFNASTGQIPRFATEGTNLILCRDSQYAESKRELIEGTFERDFVDSDDSLPQADLDEKIEDDDLGGIDLDEKVRKDDGPSLDFDDVFEDEDEYEGADDLEYEDEKDYGGHLDGKSKTDHLEDDDLYGKSKKGARGSEFDFEDDDDDDYEEDDLDYSIEKKKASGPDFDFEDDEEDEDYDDNEIELDERSSSKEMSLDLDESDYDDPEYEDEDDHPVAPELRAKKKARGAGTELDFEDEDDDSDPHGDDYEDDDEADEHGGIDFEDDDGVGLDEEGAKPAAKKSSGQSGEELYNELDEQLPARRKPSGDGSTNLDIEIDDEAQKARRKTSSEAEESLEDIDEDDDFYDAPVRAKAKKGFDNEDDLDEIDEGIDDEERATRNEKTRVEIEELEKESNVESLDEHRKKKRKKRNNRIKEFYDDPSEEEIAQAEEFNKSGIDRKKEMLDEAIEAESNVENVKISTSNIDMRVAVRNTTGAGKFDWCEILDFFDKEMELQVSKGHLGENVGLEISIEVNYQDKNLSFILGGYAKEVSEYDEDHDLVSVGLERVDKKSLDVFIRIFQLRQESIKNFMRMAKGI